MEKSIKKDIKGQTEDGLQQKCFVWFWNSYPDLRGLLFHVPNGGRRDKREAWKFKQIGLVPGVADLLLIYRNRVFCFELKNDIGSQGKKQKIWQEQVEKQGVDYFIVRTLEDFKILIRAII